MRVPTGLLGRAETVTACNRFVTSCQPNFSGCRNRDPPPQRKVMPPGTEASAYGDKPHAPMHADTLARFFLKFRDFRHMFQRPSPPLCTTHNLQQYFHGSGSAVHAVRARRYPVFSGGTRSKYDAGHKGTRRAPFCSPIHVGGTQRCVPHIGDQLGGDAYPSPPAN